MTNEELNKQLDKQHNETLEIVTEKLREIFKRRSVGVSHYDHSVQTFNEMIGTVVNLKKDV